MQEWLSHFQNAVGGQLYDRVQLLRPDYRKAMSALSCEVRKILSRKSERLSVLDVACGSAMATRMAFGKVEAGKCQSIAFYGLDSDRKMLKEAQSQWRNLKLIRAEMIQAKIKERFDVILCSFAYHHVPDSEKQRLCKRLYKWCKSGGHLFVLEICLSNNQVQPYYDGLKKRLRRDTYDRIALDFLDWTASSDHSKNGEWKVSMGQLRRDFKDAGWKMQSHKAIWTSPSLPPQTGCHLFHFRT